MTDTPPGTSLQAAFNDSGRLLSSLPAGTTIHVQTTNPADVVLITVTSPTLGLANVVVPATARCLHPGATRLQVVGTTHTVEATIPQLPRDGSVLAIHSVNLVSYFTGPVAGATVLDLAITGTPAPASRALSNVGTAVEAAREVFGSGARHLTVAADPDATGGFRVIPATKAS